MSMKIGLLSEMGRQSNLNGWMSPLDGFSEATLYAYALAGSEGEITSTGRVVSTPDLSGNGNDLVVPPSVASSQGPELEPTGFHGKPCWRFNPTDITGLIRSSFNFGDSSASKMTFVFWVQRIVTTDSRSIGGYQNNRPFLRTANVDSISWAAAGAVATSGVQVTDATMGPSCILVDFDADNDIQTLWRDNGNGGMTKIGETANTNSISQIHGGSFGIGYGGHPTTYSTPFEGRIRCFLAIRGLLTDSEKQRIGAWFERDKTSMRGPISLWILGQSNEQMDGISDFYRYAARRDILSRRHNATISGPTEYDYAWGPLNNAYNTGSVRGFDWECCTQLQENYRIKHHLFNVARSGTGFTVSPSGAADPDGWIPSSQNGGTPGALITRLTDTVNTTRNAHPIETSASTTWCIIGHKETDSLTSGGGSNYGTNLEALASELESVFPSDNFKFIIPLVHPDLDAAFRSGVRSGQETFVSSRSNAYSINCDDQTLRVDLTHYDTNYHIALGQRVASLIDLNTP